MHRITLQSTGSCESQMNCRIKFPHLLFFVSLGLLSIQLCELSHAATAAIRCQETERQALLELKRRLDDPSNRLSSWIGKDCCEWEGVRCNNITARIIRLDLRNEHYSDDDWDEFALHGDISTDSSLLSLQDLTHLDLSGNAFSGHNIPAFLGSFERLTYLNLSGTDFTGRVPEQLGNLSALRHLDLSYNYYLYVENPRWIARLTSLRHLNMNYVSFSWFQALNALPHIQHLELVSCGLGGSFPLSPTHLNFTSLLTLNLAGNSISGTEPAWLYNITTLESLNFGSNSIYWSSGSISKLTSLRALDLSTNILSQSFLLSLSNLCKLQTLNLASVPIKDKLSNLEMVFSGCLQYNLEELYLYDTQLSGSFPNWFGDIKNLKYIDLSYNSLSGSLPNSLESLVSLQYLKLGNNNLNGTIGEGIPQLKNLFQLDLSNNSLSLSLLDLANLSSLRYLDISHNILFMNESSDLIPAFQLQMLDMELCIITPRPHFPKWLQTQVNLSLLYLSSVGFEGTIPHWLPPSLKILILSNNSFSGHLSPKIGDTLPNLRDLDLSMNNFNGSIPPSLCQINSLRQLQLSNNNFSGELPNCWNNSSLHATIFDFSNNQLYGEISNSLCNLPRIQSLYLGYNHLSGKVPICLLNCIYLTTLDARHNNFTENISTWSTNGFSYLETLILSSNSLSGRIPELFNFSSLHTLDLSNNGLSGRIPELFNFLSLQTLDLSNNGLSGYIPEELRNLHYLQNLNLSSNNLIGEIPRSIGTQNIHVLDLSRNHLSGAIPSSLASLSVLNYLNLSYNNLSGSIPTGGRLQIFDPSIYAGNSYLCGPPLIKKCANNTTEGIVPEENKDGDDKKENIWLFASIALGFIFGFWGVWGTLLLHKRWRILYFRAIDNTLYKLLMEMLAEIKRKLYVEK